MSTQDLVGTNREKVMDGTGLLQTRVPILVAQIRQKVELPSIILHRAGPSVFAALTKY